MNCRILSKDTLISIAAIIWLPVLGVDCDYNPCLTGSWDHPPCRVNEPEFGEFREVIQNIDLDGNGADEINVEHVYYASDEEYRCINEMNLVPSSEIHFMANKPDRHGLDLGEEVGKNSDFLPTHDGVMGLQSYELSKIVSPFGGFTSWYLNSDRLNAVYAGKTAVMFGFKHTFEGDTHFGWIEFQRDCGGPWATYSLGRIGYHPLPNIAVYAGLAPSGPKLSFTQENGAWTLNWPPEADTLGFQLEGTELLGDQAQWLPIAVSKPGQFSVAESRFKYYRLALKRAIHTQKPPNLRE